MSAPKKNTTVNGKKMVSMERGSRTPVSDIAFTPAVKVVQERMGSRKGYASMEDGAGWKNRIDPGLEAFIGERDSFYLGTASAAGRPYIQHRGGHKGFLKVIDDSTLAFADYTGNPGLAFDRRKFGYIG